jgi:hypothetical protein
MYKLRKVQSNTTENSSRWCRPPSGSTYNMFKKVDHQKIVLVQWLVAKTTQVYKKKGEKKVV